MIRGLLTKATMKFAKPIAHAINFWRFVNDREQVIAALHAAHRVHEKQKAHIALLQKELQEMSIAKSEAEADLAKFRGDQIEEFSG